VCVSLHNLLSRTYIQPLSSRSNVRDKVPLEEEEDQEEEGAESVRALGH
jgi:hypothetical protein